MARPSALTSVTEPPVICLGIQQLNSSDYVLVEASFKDGKLDKVIKSEPMAFHLAVFQSKRRAAEVWLPKS